MDPHEEWRQHKPFPCYWVSNLGRVKRIYKNGNEKYLNPCTNYKGYKWIDLVRRPKRERIQVHVMVASCFIDNPDNKLFVDHINEDKADNCVSNLRWATNSENQRNITKLRSTNTSGCVGVTSKTYKGLHWKWCARISLHNERIILGHFDDYNDAVKARRDAERKYFADFCPNRD